MNIWRLGTRWGNTPVLDVILETKVGFFFIDWPTDGVDVDDIIAITTPWTRTVEAIGIAGSKVLPLSKLLDQQEQAGALSQWINDAKGFRFKKIWTIPKEKQFQTADFKRFYSLRNDHRAWNKALQIVNLMQSEEKMKDFCQLLKNCHNLILTGAPGTGKTYLAKEIAKEITKDKDDTPKDKRHWEFVQFHPSYDYTDFVEGLRPTPPDKENGNIGFQGEDGVFKAFCKRAINNQASNFEEAYKKLCDELEENYSQDHPLKLETQAQNKPFRVFLNSNGSLSLITGEDESNVVQGSLTPQRMQTFLTPSPYKYWKSYFSAVLEYMKQKYGLKTEPVNPNQKYVFIIDEINRGDIAKIFGELFFAIDPDYRGKKGTIKTQYANLFQDDEVFPNGMFYVPENVYIIGTMNDIDRNVECMDFAIRRRFTWVEIEPKDTISMWNDPEKGIPEYRDKAQTCMKAINKKIANTPGLGSAYQLGAAYFLKLKNYTGTPAERFGQLWKNHIKPLLKEYLRGMPNAEETLSGMEQIWKENTPSNPTESVAIPAEVQAETEQQAESIEPAPSSADTEQQ